MPIAVYPPAAEARAGWGQEAATFATIFQGPILSFVLFFGCLAVVASAGRGDQLDRSLHFLLLTPARRDTILAGKYLAGLSASVALFGASVLVTLVLLIGIFQMVMGLLRMGWVTRFIPFSVMTGFMTGVAVLIIIGQLGDFTGYYSSYWSKIVQVTDLVVHLGSILWATLAVGVLTILLVYGLNRTRASRFSLVFALVLASAAAGLLNQYVAADIKQVKDVAEVPRSLPSPVLPDPKLILDLILPAIAVGIIGLVQGAGVSQTFPNPDGKFSAFAIALYAIMHASGSTGLIPTTGLPMPFLNYGGMSLFFTMCSMGILLNISRRKPLEVGPTDYAATVGIGWRYRRRRVSRLSHRRRPARAR